MIKVFNSPSLLLLWMILISMAIAPAIFLGEGNRNLFLIVVMSLPPVVLIVSHKFYRSEIWLLLFLASIVTIPPLVHPESMRWSTVIYSLMFGFTFLAYSRLLHSSAFTIENYLSFLKYMIYGYFVVLLIQQFCVLTGLPIFNVSNYNPMEPYKLNALAAEPSHSARIVALLMYSYITIKEIITENTYNFRVNLKEDAWIWISFLWTMLTMGSGTAFLFIIIVLLKFIRFKSLIPLLLIGGIITYIVSIIGITAFERTFEVFMATLTLDPRTIIQTDLSAAIRIVPIILLASIVTITTVDGLFGHGIDTVSSFLYSQIPGVGEGFTGGGLFQVWYEYGFFSFIFFVFFSLGNSYKKLDYLSVVFWFLLVFMNGVNSQIVWLAILLLWTNIYFNKFLKGKK